MFGPSHLAKLLRLPAIVLLPLVLSSCLGGSEESRSISFTDDRGWTKFRIVSSANNTYNHDYFGEGEPLFRRLRDRGIRVMRNEVDVIEKDGTALVVAAGMATVHAQQTAIDALVQKARAERPKS